MKIPITWLKDFVDIDLPLEELAAKMTMAGLEVEEIHLVGLCVPEGQPHEFKITGLAWSADKLVVAQIDEVMAHPNADRLVLCQLNDGTQKLTVLTGAPNLFEYKGTGPLPSPIKVAYAREGSRLYDGHQPGEVLTTLKRTRIRGVESFSMVCSEKELGISEEHEGIIILDPDAPTGMPLCDYMGDAVFEINILPNMIRDACILGVAREVSAITGKPLRQPQTTFKVGKSAMPEVKIDIQVPELNPRFVLGMIKDIKPEPSPYWVQRRLRLAGMRPINGIVDATNYVMLEVGQPLHAFDYDVLVTRANGAVPTILTRTAFEGEHLVTLDGVDRALKPVTVLVCDPAGSLSIAGIMGGTESEVSESTRNVLLEGASWNYINIRKTLAYLKLSSEAGFRFSRGIHPAVAPWGVQLGLQRMFEWGGGEICQGLVDNYPHPVIDPKISISEEDVVRHLGINIKATEIAWLLEALEFKCQVDGNTVQAMVPPHRMDISAGLVGKADLVEEIARLYGYDKIPSLQLADQIPDQRNNPGLEVEEKVKDVLVSLDFQEVITHRLTSVERDGRSYFPGTAPNPTAYVRLINPIAPDRDILRRSLLASVLEILERNARLKSRLALFEVGPVYIPQPGQVLPEEPLHLVIAMTGMRELPFWKASNSTHLDFFDLKGAVEILLSAFHIPDQVFEPASDSGFHPGKCAWIKSAGRMLGVLGELHPLVKAQYDFGESPVLVADIDFKALLDFIPSSTRVQPVPVFPYVNEDIAIIVDEKVPAGQVEMAIRDAGGKLLASVSLFDIYRGEQIGVEKKSLAYSLTYQATDRTLTDAEAAQLRQRIVRRLERDFEARLRSL